MLPEDAAFLEGFASAAPDFAIIGAMKCGTTSLHHALESHPTVYMPPGEVKLFAIDEVEPYPIRSVRRGTTWHFPEWAPSARAFGEWYRRLYAPRAEGGLAGEDSPSLMASPRAIDRMARLFPSLKYFVCLRDPVERLISHYWHNVKGFGSYFDLADTLCYAPGLLYWRSRYLAQVRHLLDRVPREQVHFLVLEEAVADPTRVYGDAFKFLGLEAPPPSPSVDGGRRNPGRYPRRLGVALLRNRLFRDQYARASLEYLPGIPPAPPMSGGRQLLLKALDRASGWHTGKTPPTDAGTRAFLSARLAEDNDGLGELIGKDLGQWWPCMKRG